MKFGRRGIKTDYRTLKLAKYLTATLPPPPPSANQFERAMQNVADSDFTDLFPMDYNDELGDCTIAGLAHALTLFQGMTSQGMIPAADDVKGLYLSLSGGQDTGLYCLDVLNHVQSNDVLGDKKFMAFAAIDPKNHTHVKQAIALFGCVYLGFQCQESVVEDFQARTTWTPGNLTQDGHCVAAGGYDNDTVTVATWGNWQKGTWAWWDQTVDEAYAILPAEAGDPSFHPGVDLAQLQADLDTLKAA